MVMIDGKECACEVETWNCDDGPIDVAIDASGCPINPKYCKQHAGAEDLLVAAGAIYTLTIAVTNLTKARVRAIILEASDPAAAIPGLSALPQLTVTSILLLQNQLISGTVPANRFAHDVTGPNFAGLSAWVRGAMGTAGGILTILGVNRSSIALNVYGSVDIDGIVN